MKIKLNIEDFEDKKTKAGKGYTRFKTSDGWMSCFNDKAIPLIKQQVGNDVELDIVESGDFKNIKDVFGIAEPDSAMERLQDLGDKKPKGRKSTLG